MTQTHFIRIRWIENEIDFNATDLSVRNSIQFEEVFFLSISFEFKQSSQTTRDHFFIVPFKEEKITQSFY